PRQPTTQPCAAAVVFAPRPRRPPSSALFPYTTLFRSLATPVVAVLAVLLRNRPFTVEASAQEQETAETPQRPGAGEERSAAGARDRKSTRLNSSHVKISYAVFCLKKKTSERLRRRVPQ